MAALSDPIFTWVLALALGMARLLPCLFMLPLFSFHELRGMPRYAITLALALMVTPGVQPMFIGEAGQSLPLIGLFAKEVLLGLMLGIILYTPFWLMESMGGLFDNQRGALIGGQLNPAMGADFTPLGDLMKKLLVLVLFMNYGIQAMTDLIWHSYRLWPPSAWLPQFTLEGWDSYLALLTRTFQYMALYAAPMVIILLFVEFAMALIGLYAPQLQVFILAMPMKALIGLFFLIVYLPTLLHLMNDELARLPDVPILLDQLVEQPQP